MDDQNKKDNNSESLNPFGSDKRYIPRWDVDNRVIFSYHNGQHQYEARTKDLSCAGACLLTNRIAPEEHQIKLKVFLSEHISFDVTAHVVWKSLSDGEFSLGVTFDDITPDIQELILTYAFEVKKDDVIKHWFSGWSDGKDTAKEKTAAKSGNGHKNSS